MTRAPRVVHLDELEAIPGPGSLTWHPVRAHLGLRAFGCNAYSAAKVGGPPKLSTVVSGSAATAWRWVAVSGTKT